MEPLKITAPGLDRAHSALKALVTETTGVLIQEPRVVTLFYDGALVGGVTITISNEEVWREFAHDLGFKP